MALPNISASDFTGLINISADTFQAADLQAAIPVLRDEVIVMLLGAEAYAFLENNNRTRWDAFFAGTTWTDDKGNVRTLYPNISILRSLIYARYIPTQSAVNTNTGFVENYNENAKATTGANVGAISAKAQARAAMWWEKSTIPFIEKFRVVKETVSSATQVSPGAYLLAVPATTYLGDGDSVEVAGETFQVFDVLPTSFTINVAPTFDVSKFINAVATWEPFEIICKPTPQIEVANL